MSVLTKGFAYILKEMQICHAVRCLHLMFILYLNWKSNTLLRLLTINATKFVGNIYCHNIRLTRSKFFVYVLRTNMLPISKNELDDPDSSLCLFQVITSFILTSNVLGCFHKQRHITFALLKHQL